MGRFFSLVVAFCLVALTPPAAAQAPQPGKTYTLKDLVIETPWSRETPTGARVAGGYLKITNKGSAADRLVGGTFALAGRFEVHEMAVVDGVMRMRELEKGLEIRPGQTVELRPGGYHVMFMELKEGLKAGQTIKGTLIFANAGTIEVEYAIVARTEQKQAPGGHSGHGGHGAGHGGHKKH
jgi:periplasmic copper chaperone A